MDIKLKNAKFIERFMQTSKLALSDLGVKREIKQIREFWKIPKDGFSDVTIGFTNWLKQQEQDNFQRVSIVFEGLQCVSAKPKYFLNKLLYCLEEDEGEYPDSLYFLENEETFNAISKEKPFPGIVHFILFNKIFLPESEQLQLTFDSHNNIVLRIGANASMEDLEEFYPIVKSFQKGMEGYRKGERRYSDKFDNNFEVLIQEQTRSKRAVELLTHKRLVDPLQLEKAAVAMRQRKRRLSKRRKKIVTGS